MAKTKKKKKQNHRKGTVQKKQGVQLSQCMIVKNEEENIEQALSWGKEIVCEQIVVDTGSTDQTAELARQMGAKVFSYSWDGDFSAAKNFAIEKARGNWIAFLDADESFSPEETKKLDALLAETHPCRQVDALRTKLANLDSDGSILSVSCQDRIFRRTPQVQYRNRIHEELYRRGGASLVYRDVQDELMILHTGYAGAEKRQHKGERNIQMLEEELKRNPHDGMCWAYLGDAYKSIGKWKDALESYRRVLEDPEMEMTHEIAPLRAGLEIMGLLGNRPIEERREKYLHIKNRLMELGKDDHPDIDYFLGCMHLSAGEMEEASVHYENALKKLETYHGIEITRASSELEMLNRVIATNALLKGEPPKAVSFAVAALRVNKYSADGIRLLLRAFLTEWKEGQSAEPYWQFLCKIYNPGSLKDLMFLYKFAAEEGFTALQQQVLMAIPEEAREQVQRQMQTPNPSELSVSWSLTYQ